MIILPSHFTTGGEVDFLARYSIGGGRLARLSLRKVGDIYQLYARVYNRPQPEDIILFTGTLEAMVKEANTITGYGDTVGGPA